MVFVFMAQEEGFEPPCLLGKRFSRPPRCDRFDIPAYFLKFVFRILALASIFAEWRNIPAYWLYYKNKFALVYDIIFLSKCQYLFQKKHLKSIHFKSIAFFV